MNPQDFGTLALQLLEAANIPGKALDQAVAFREVARAMAEGRVVTSPAKED